MDNEKRKRSCNIPPEMEVNDNPVCKCLYEAAFARIRASHIKYKRIAVKP
jgi:hypothetical protein